jgi:CelD/BcsL family acetyltransferase involved in cellulose biosynthesis
MIHFEIDPLADYRWAEFIDHHPSSSVFHTRAWLQALNRTYGFTPIVLTSSHAGTDLTNGLLFCRIRSRITGSRLVSLPFSDHCQPLSAPEELLRALPEICDREKLKYVELRPLAPLQASPFSPSKHYYFHSLDLRPSLEDIFHRFHANCIRRKIRRARREGLALDAGRSDVLLDEFYNLQVITRRRQGLPPQPKQWFKNLLDAMDGDAVIRVARYQGRAISAILTLRHKQTIVYKYGCSDASFNNRGGTQLLLWKAIEEAKAEGMQFMDLGRCDIEAEGLAIFKERWGAKREESAYFRYPARPSGRDLGSSVFSVLPKTVLILIGRLLYRHIP